MPDSPKRSLVVVGERIRPDLDLHEIAAIEVAKSHGVANLVNGSGSSAVGLAPLRVRYVDLAVDGSPPRGRAWILPSIGQHHADAADRSVDGDAALASLARPPTSPS